MQSVPITTKVVSLNPAHGEVYSIQNYGIKFVSDLRQVGGFRATPVSSTNKTGVARKPWYNRNKKDIKRDNYNPTPNKNIV